ncbi:hypothetical protein N0V91_009868 [Didymella pomorum]|uniref:Uncharacterized protein n=1 Tax=Didymella pomorum TaxID=749634 RepID=A0A9W9D3I4_9PLEO|nr:hypothetical protein N0V91_009868 [Didymella pomorum]
MSQKEDEDAGRSACEYIQRKNGAARIKGLRQETEELSRASASLMKDNSTLKELLDRMQQGTEDEAYSIYLQLRSEPDISVLGMARHLSLQVSDGTSEPDAESSADFAIAVTEKEVQPIAVKAWNTVADDGLVSELVTSWFMWDDTHTEKLYLSQFE